MAMIPAALSPRSSARGYSASPASRGPRLVLLQPRGGGDPMTHQVLCLWNVTLTRRLEGRPHRTPTRRPAGSSGKTRAARSLPRLSADSSSPASSSVSFREVPSPRRRQSLFLWPAIGSVPRVGAGIVVVPFAEAVDLKRLGNAPRVTGR